MTSTKLHTATLKRRWGLDLLRAVAILTVIESHGRYISEKLGNKLQYIGLTDGVDLFFVLSGFLIGTILINDYNQNHQLSIKKFWMRRWLRTLPVYLVALLVNIFFMLFIFKYDFSINDMLKHFLFIQNAIPPYGDHRFFSEAWSLSIEEYFYLTIPLLIGGIIYFTRRKETGFVFINALAVMLIFSLACRAYVYYRLPQDALSLTEWNTRFRIIIPERLDSLAIGVIAAYVRIFYSSLWNNKKIVLASFCVGLILMILLDRTWIFNGTIPQGFFACVPYFAIYSAAVALTLPFLDSWQPSPNIFTRFVSLTSKLSYSMYLFHNSLIAIPFKNYTHTIVDERIKITLYITYWILVYLLAYLAYTYIEKPVLKYRDSRYN